MSRMPLVFTLAVLCLSTSLACGQGWQTVANDHDHDHADHDHADHDHAQPAKAEPGENGPNGLIEKYQRAVAPITDTKPTTKTVPMSVAEDAESAKPSGEVDLRAELLELRQDFQSRLSNLEAQLEVIRLTEKTTTTEKLVLPTDADTDAAKGVLSNSDASEVAKLRQELDDLLSKFGELEVAIADHADAINDHAQGLQLHSDAIKAHEKQLADTAADLNDAQDDREALSARVKNAAGLQVYGNMQESPEFRADLYRNVRYRVKIRNTTGAEQRLFVNGASWIVRTDEWTFVPVPLGPVTLQKSGERSLVVLEDHVNWQADNRGFFVEYDLDLNQVAKPVKN